MRAQLVGPVSSFKTLHRHRSGGAPHVAAGSPVLAECFGAERPGCDVGALNPSASACNFRGFCWLGFAMEAVGMCTTCI
ncbi:hypothetical protein TOPH_04840 [Tolypocladium ophioglossoides CBS 100239]|uniref:Uncharacterized protein n=1 Tax=Tolypocladium ophioglossoides (strain CBS 100239) TaxID=1163406 RepID=A0A0L0N9C4_TOLOC|nr:hypothetical protein TOPH_04840 [Tolypocladium ophioglossoides CBS 100239]